MIKICENKKKYFFKMQYNNVIGKCKKFYMSRIWEIHI